MKILPRGNGLLLLCLLLSSIFLNAQRNTLEVEDIPTPFDPAYYQGLKWRNIGPFRGGRSNAVAGVLNQPLTYYMGTTGGGVWKTEDAGLSWFNISDGFFNVGSIGAIAVAPSNPNVIYVGTGEHAVRGVMTSHGDGMYRSLDAGKTWEHIGLSPSRQIAAVLVHPNDPDRVWVAVQGAPYGPTVERGVYKTDDGGQNWRKVLYVNPTTGCSDLSMDPTNPRILYAGTWDHLREPWMVRSGGSGSGLYKSTDGGESWVKMKKGLPEEMGKTSITVSPANPEILYANIEAKKGGVYRSNDAGETWKRTCDDRVTVARAWYYIEIFADPVDPETVYVLNAPMLKSTDGGRSFKSIPNPHSDQHDLWINPNNPRNMILGNDGGACVSFNGGNSWSPQSNQPTGQFYRVIADARFPYYLYGGQQDNSTVAIVSRTNDRGIDWKDWYPVAGGESAFIAFDPKQPDLVYGGSYQGNLDVYDQRTKETKDIMAYPNVGLSVLPSEMKYRFNWNAPLVTSPQNPAILYHGANVVLKSGDGGMSWQPISPDLTRNEKEKQGPGGGPYTNEGAGGENYNTLSYLACSPHSREVIWAGSDDGLVHLTQDGGASWKEVTPEGIGEALINCIEVSPHDPAKAFIVATRYKFNDFKPMVYRTTDFGQSWKKVVRGIQSTDFARVVREDPDRKDLVYAGTETGIYISDNGGDRWRKFQLNLPIMPINDLCIRDNDLIAASSGRGFWILDDLSCLQQSAGRLLNGRVQMFEPRETVRYQSGGGPSASTEQGNNPLNGVIIDYYLPPGCDTLTLTLEVMDATGKVIRTYSNKKDPNFQSYPGGPPAEKLLPTTHGVNRVNWDMRRKAIPHVPGLFVLGDYRGSLVPPGDYRLRMRTEIDDVEKSVRIVPDPRLEVTVLDYHAQADFLTKIEATVTDLHQSVKQMRDVRTQLKDISKRLEKLGDYAELKEEADSLISRMTTWEEQLVQPQQKTFQDVVNFQNQLNSELMNLLSRCGDIDPRITDGAKERFRDLNGEWQEHRRERDAILLTAVPSFNKSYKEANLGTIIVGERQDDMPAASPRY